MEKRYIIKGTWKGRRIEEAINANSKSQAKLRAGFNSGIYGNELTEFMNSRKIKVKKA